MGSNDREGLTGMVPTLGGVAAGLLAAFAAVVVPLDALESLVTVTGIADSVPVAAPPLGMTARALLALGGGIAAGAVGWAILYLLFGPDGFVVRSVASADQPSVRRADAHPDAPWRRPLSVADIGVPPPTVMAPPLEQPLPVDLNQPLAAFDPTAVPAVPRAPTPPLPALAPPPALRSGERIETFDLSPRMAGDTQPSIEQLLRRLERGTVGRLA